MNDERAGKVERMAMRPPTLMRQTLELWIMLWSCRVVKILLDAFMNDSAI